MLKFCTWNVNGIRAREAQAVEWLVREQPDVLCLQEVKASPEQVPESLREAPGYWGLWHGHKGYSGVALLLRKERFAEPPGFFHPEFNFENRIVAASAETYTFISVYVPNGGKDFSAKQRFLLAMEDYIDAARRDGKTVLLGGDLNIAREPRDVHEKLRNEEQLGQTAGERKQLEEILGHGLVDVGRALDPDNDGLFTWWAPWRNMRQRNMGWRLDYVLASHALAGRAQQSSVAREFGTSDHAPVTVTFDL